MSRRALAALLGICGLAPSAPGQAVPESGYALLAYDASSGRIAAAVATTGFAAASGALAADPRAGAAVVLGRPASLAARQAIASLAAGIEPALALAGDDAPRAPRGVAAILSRDCEGAVSVADGAPPWTGGFRGTAGSVCYAVVGELLPDERVVRALEAAFRDGTADLLDRVLAGLKAAEGRLREAPRSRSAAVWILSADGMDAPLGLSDLRLQVEDHARPILALETLIGRGRAEAVAREANRLVDAGRYAEGLTMAREALALEPTTAAAWLAGGRAQMFEDSVEEAERWFRRMLELNPYLLEALGDLETGEPVPGVIPYDPRLLERLALYRAAFFPDITFPRLPDPD
ncbi:MAG: DUF1028 domain-containing protein [Gemmatimonadota bacterium]